MVAIAPYKGDIELIGINNPISDHQLIFYPNAVVTKAGIYLYTSYAFLKDSYVWQMINEYPTLVNADGRAKITVEGWVSISSMGIKLSSSRKPLFDDAIEVIAKCPGEIPVLTGCFQAGFVDKTE